MSRNEMRENENVPLNAVRSMMCYMALFHHLSLLSAWGMGPLIFLLQATLSLAATSA